MRVVAWCLADFLAALLAVVIVAVAPTRARVEGEKKDALFLITADWSVNEDADVDLWVLTPSGKPVAYMSRDVGCAKLDTDARGWMDGRITNPDGSVVNVITNKETVSLRCITPGTWPIGVNLYAYRAHDGSVPADGAIGLKVRIEVHQMNPEFRTIFAKDVTLDSVGETINATTLNLDSEGTHPTFSDPPLEPITAQFYRHGAANQAIP